MLSILKTYNNQDGEFRVFDRYPAQLGFEGALFKWFKYKFLPGGKFAQRPILYVDGDESLTNGGLEETIGNEISLKRNNDDNFFLVSLSSLPLITIGKSDVETAALVETGSSAKTSKVKAPTSVLLVGFFPHISSCISHALKLKSAQALRAM